MKTKVYFYRGGVECGATVAGRPSYVWRDGYSEAGPNGEIFYPWLTQREAQAEAKRDGFKAVFKNEKPNLNPR